MSKTWFKLWVLCPHCSGKFEMNMPKNYIPLCPSCGKPMTKEKVK